MMPSLVETQDLAKAFGAIKAVDGITLRVDKGEVLGFLGPNGAGKSTTMKLITGFLTPDKGTAYVAGIDVIAEPKAAKRRFGYLPEGAPSYSDMSTSAFLSFIAQIRGLDGGKARDAIETAVERTGLESVLEQKIDTLSKGFRRRVGLAQAILHDPEVLIMDEPTDGLDPNQKHHVRELIRTMAKEKAIIVSTHILEEVEAVCTRAIVIDKGRIVADGTADDLARRMPYHNAVAITVERDMAEAVRAALGTLPRVGKVETVAHDGHAVRIRAIPKAGETIAADVAGLVKDKALKVEELVVERGRLDEVFRQITSPDTGGRHA
jgi:ABC-2 type transport system ATP-binding protein